MNNLSFQNVVDGCPGQAAGIAQGKPRLSTALDQILDVVF
jgi:hypothetical protein